MTTPEKSDAILRAMLALAYSGKPVTLSEDVWGGNTATIQAGGAHSHVGVPDGSWETLVDGLYALLCEGRGLTWA